MIVELQSKSTRSPALPPAIVLERVVDQAIADGKLTGYALRDHYVARHAKDPDGVERAS